MAGYKEFIEIDVNSENIETVDGTRTVDDSGRIAVGRDKAGRTFEKIILVDDAESIPE